MTTKLLLKRIVQLLLIGALAYFILPVFIDSVQQFNPSDWHINYPLLILSLLLMQLVLFLQSAIWSQIVTFFGKEIRIKKAFRVAYLAQLGRYLPGRVWQLFGMIYLAGKEGIKKEEATLSFILSQTFATPPGLLIVMLYLFVIRTPVQYQRYAAFGWVAGVIFLAFLVVFFRADLLKKIINWVIRLIRQPEVDFTIKKGVGLRILLFYFLTWNLYGIAFYLFLRSILPGYDLNLMEIVGAWTLGYLIGYWTIILPAGIGAREAVLILLLSPIIGADRAGIAVMGARAWSIVGEVICTLLAWVVKYV